MQNFKVKLLVSLISTAILFSCTKSGDNAPPPFEKPVKLVKKISSTANDYVTYEYNATGKVTKYVSQWQNGTGGLNKLTNVYEYSGDKLVRFSNEAGQALYSYKDGLIEKSENFAVNGRKLSTLLYIFKDGKLDNVIEQITTPLPDNATETKVSYQYHSNGNVSRIDFAYRKELADPFTISFSKLYVEYDNKKNPEPDDILGFFIPGVVLQINNPIKVNNMDANGKIDGYSRYEYTYNTQGFPSQRKQFIAIGTNEQSPVTFQYTY